jgi:pimeloyl-ACP methyl ester carboxylesterase
MCSIPMNTRYQRLVDVDGHRMAAIVANDNAGGTPLVLLHGITLSPRFWAPHLPPSIRDGRHWLSLSLPGHHPGTMPLLPRRAITPELFAHLIDATLQEVIGDRRAIVIGYSTGGFAALALAAHRPERVRAVCSINGFAYGPWGGTLGLLQQLAGMGAPGAALFRVLSQLSVSSKAIFGLVLGQYAGDRAAYRTSPVAGQTLDAIFPDVHRHDPEVMRRLFDGLRDVDLRPDLARIAVPTLIVGGDRDPILPPEHQRDVAEHIPGSELVLFDGCGHLFYAERTARYQRVLTNWLARFDAG